MAMKNYGGKGEYRSERSLYRCCCSSWCHALEEACIETVDSQKMTKDLAICIHGLQKYVSLLRSFIISNQMHFSVKEGMYLNTKDFINEVKATLNKKLA